MERFRMSHIQVKQFAILGQELPHDNIGLQTELSYQYSKEAKVIACTAGFKFGSEQKPLLLLEVQCEFGIHPDDWAAMQTNSGINISAALREILAMHTIGTSRGILFCKTEGSALNSLIIPPINVAEMIPSQLN